MNENRGSGPSVSVVIPTFRREEVLLSTISQLLQLKIPPAEILVVDQTPSHNPQTETGLQELHEQGKIRWIRLPHPSIPGAMNTGLCEAEYNTVLFLDDDIVPGPELVEAHTRAQAQSVANIVAGQVLQPWDQQQDVDHEDTFRFSSGKRQFISGLMAGNFSIKRDVAMKLGGFDENFVRVAYRFETEFAERALACGEKILFEPAAGIRHLKFETGGTRSYGEHLTTMIPAHSVGAYYYFLRTGTGRSRPVQILGRLIGSVLTRYHLRHPWWIPVTLIAETLGFLWAILLSLTDQKLIPINQRQTDARSSQPIPDCYVR